MADWTDARSGRELSPVLLLIREMGGGHVFGAVASSPLQPAEHYYGTGDSCLLFRFTGNGGHRDRDDVDAGGEGGGGGEPSDIDSSPNPRWAKMIIVCLNELKISQF